MVTSYKKDIAIIVGNINDYLSEKFPTYTNGYGDNNPVRVVNQNGGIALDLVVPGGTGHVTLYPAVKAPELYRVLVWGNMARQAELLLFGYLGKE